MSFRLRTSLAWAASLLVAFALGALTPKLRAYLRPPAAQANFFTDVQAREEAACPKPGPRTMVALVLGQSLAGNWAGERSIGRDGVLNFYNGRCYRARDPLLGATGGAGNHWTQVANALRDANRYDDIVLVQATRGQTAIKHFEPPNPGFAAVEAESARLQSLPVTHVFIQQGQTDDINATPPQAYRESYAKLLAGLIRLWPQAAIFVSIESGYCRDERNNRAPAPENPIQQVQRSLVAPAQGIYQGPDVDVVVDGSKRYDGCHPSGTGAQLLAQAWTKVILDHGAR